MRIVANGGGEIGRLETSELDAEVVRLTGKRRPRLVFLPTAAADDPGYVAIVEQHYGQRLGCQVSPLLLYDHRAAVGDAERTLRSADIVYVGGGNTLRMMKLWRRRGVDTALRQAAADGTVLAGISAGAICWCWSGVSDSRSFTTTGGSWEYIAVRGLGLVDIVMCPHFNADADRQTAAVSIARRRRRSVLGLDDSTALEIVDQSWRILSARDGSRAHLVDRSGAVHARPPSTAFRPLRDLSNP